MPAPAITGQLRTKVSDMQVGDYIVCNYVAGTSGALGTFSNLGGAAGTEIPVASSATPNGSFYFVKGDKGLLISDRVVQSSISWDTLNTGKVIQGLPWDAGNVIPIMTSDTAPSGVASASSETSNFAWSAFDNNNATRWSVAFTAPQWVAYKFNTPVTIRRYAITGDAASATGDPKTWTFEGSNDGGVTWQILDTQSSQTGWANSEKRSFLVPNPKAFTSYRVNISANNGAGILYVGTLEMMDTAGIIRSLTGGVSYADANGNYSAANPGGFAYGAWPTNNEYDKYIVQKDYGTGTGGLDNIWHGNSIYSWVQETPEFSSAASTNRVERGNNGNPKAISYDPSSMSTYSGVGFRPVFEYKE
jgi:hypothetical protein